MSRDGGDLPVDMGEGTVGVETGLREIRSEIVIGNWFRFVNWFTGRRSAVKRQRAFPEFGSIRGAEAHFEVGFGYTNPSCTRLETSVEMNERSYDE